MDPTQSSSPARAGRTQVARARTDRNLARRDRTRAPTLRQPPRVLPVAPAVDRLQQRPVARVTPVEARPVDLRSTVTFGNSLTDNQTLAPAYFKRWPWLYGHDPMELVFDKNQAPGDQLVSYAIAGSYANWVAIQAGIYTAANMLGEQPTATFVGLELGGNDLFRAFTRYGARLPGEDEGYDRETDLLAQRFRDLLDQLLSATPDTTPIVLWTLPNIWVTARYFTTMSEAEIASVTGHTDKVNEVVRALGDHPRVALFDVERMMRELATEPPSVGGVQLEPPPANGKPNNVFADAIHPTAVSNAIAANRIVATLNKKFDAEFVGYNEVELAAFATEGGAWIP
jgi:lysophospholipase L1-like esterase